MTQFKLTQTKQIPKFIANSKSKIEIINIFFWSTLSHVWTLEIEIFGAFGFT
jgi:hypothetical protein